MPEAGIATAVDAATVDHAPISTGAVPQKEATPATVETVETPLPDVEKPQPLDTSEPTVEGSQDAVAADTTNNGPAVAKDADTANGTTAATKEAENTDKADEDTTEKKKGKLPVPKTTLKLTEDEEQKLAQMIEKLPNILAKTDNPEYDEIYGYRINSNDKPHVDEVARNEILLKFLRADLGDLLEATTRLKKTFNWRNKFQPLSAAWDEKFDEGLNLLGVIVSYPKGQPNLKVVTFNLYGKMKSLTKLFDKFGGGGSNEKPGSNFLRWRIGLMERGLLLLDYTDPDNRQMANVHDYTGVLLFRADKKQKESTKEIIEIFGAHYPELLSTKFFVGVPFYLAWVFSFLKTIGIVSKETLKKFNVISGTDLASEKVFPELPKFYGGTLAKDIHELATKDAKIPAYGEILLKQMGESQIKNELEEVE